MGPIVWRPFKIQPWFGACVFPVEPSAVVTGLLYLFNFPALLACLPLKMTNLFLFTPFLSASRPLPRLPLAPPLALLSPSSFLFPLPLVPFSPPLL